MLECGDGLGGGRYIGDAVLSSVGVGSFRFSCAEALDPGNELTASFQYRKCHLDVEAHIARRLCAEDGGRLRYEALIDSDCAPGMEDLLRRYLTGLAAPGLRELLAAVLFPRRGAPGDGGAEVFFRLAGLFGDMGGHPDKRGFALGMLEELMGSVGSEWAALRLFGVGGAAEAFASLGERPPEAAVLDRPVYDRGGRRVGTVEVAEPARGARASEAVDQLALVFSRLFGPHEIPASLPREHAMVGESEGVGILRECLSGLKDADDPLLLCGEAGTGKALYARIVHAEGRRGDAPFKEVDCAVRDIGESLFGGLAGGTLFLRNLHLLGGDLQEGLHALLAGAGDVRVVASIHGEPGGVLSPGLQGYFRTRLVVPPLCERGGDALLLAGYFLDREQGRTCAPKRVFSAREVREIEGHRWPGNVAELERYVAGVSAGPSAPRRQQEAGGTLKERLARVERAMIISEIELAGGNKSEAARRMGLSREALRKKLLQGKKSAA